MASRLPITATSTASSLQDKQPSALGDDERARLLALADDLPQLWNHPAASAETRKRILRAVLKEIIVTVTADRLHLVLHWHGGDHTRLEVVKNRVGQNRWKTALAGSRTRTRGPSRDPGDHDDWDRTCPVCCRLGIHGWNGRCVWLGWGLMVNPGVSPRARPPVRSAALAPGAKRIGAGLSQPATAGTAASASSTAAAAKCLNPARSMSSDQRSRPPSAPSRPGIA